MALTIEIHVKKGDLEFTVKADGDDAKEMLKIMSPFLPLDEQTG